MEFENISGTEIVINRIFILASLLLSTLFVGKYLEIWDRVEITKIQPQFLKVPAIIGVVILIPFLMMVVLVLVESFF